MSDSYIRYPGTNISTDLSPELNFSPEIPLVRV